MSKVARAIGTVAGVVASVAAFVPGGQVVAAAAGAISAISGTVAQLTAKPPVAQGSTSSIVLNPDGPAPYSIGRTYVGGHIVHDVGYGPTKDKVENPNRSTVYIYSGAGPVHSIEKLLLDFNQYTPSGSGAVGGYYAGHLYYTSKLGARNDGNALSNEAAPDNVGKAHSIPDWSINHKLSSWACGMATAIRDEKGEVFGGGLPQHGVVGKWVKVYDPRKDSTYPGGSGSHRFNNEETWEWSENAALHALTYAYGRYSQNPQRPGKIFGIGLSPAAIDIPAFINAANVNDANNWKVGGTIYEPGDKWNNLKLIMEAGGMTPGWNGARLTCDVHAPGVAVDTITKDDLAGGYEVPGMKSWKERINTIIPKIRSEAHDWEFVPTDKVEVQQYIDEDGEAKPKGHKYSLVQHADQGAQLSMYKITDSREIGPIVLTLKPRLMSYGYGDFLNIDIEELGLDHLAKITGRDVDIVNGTVTLTFVTDAPGKHPLALGQTSNVPPSPSLLVPGYLDNIRNNQLTGLIVDRVVNSDEYISLSDEVVDVTQALDTETQARAQAITDAINDFAEGVIDQEALDAAIQTANDDFSAAINNQSQQLSDQIAQGLVDEQDARDQAIAQAEADFRAGLITQTGLDVAIQTANDDFSAAITAEQQARAIAISEALSDEATARDQAIAQAEADFRAGLITQTGLDTAINSANQAFADAIAVEQQRISAIEVYNANSTQLIRDGNGITGITYNDANGNPVTSPYNVFWDAFGIVTAAGVTGPFLYDPTANVTYMDTAFIRHLSVDTIHIRDGSITRPVTLSQGSPGVGNMGSISSSLVTFGNPIVIESGGFIGQSIYTSVGFQVFNNTPNAGVIQYDVRKHAYTDPSLTTSTYGNPGGLMTRGKGYIHPRIDNPFTVTFIDEGIISYAPSWTTYELRIAKNPLYNDASSMLLRNIDFNSLLSKR